MQPVLIGALSALLPAVPVDGASDETVETIQEPVREQNAYVFSGLGPGSGKTAIGIGGRVLYVLPMLDLHVVHGFTDRLDLEARVSSLALLTFADLGLRYRIIGDEKFSLAVRANANAVGIFAIVAEAGSLGAAGGLTASFGDEDWQLSLSQDVPVHFLQGIAAGRLEDSANEIAVVSRTTLAFETMVAKETSLYVAGQLYVPIVRGQAGVLPFLALGASF